MALSVFSAVVDDVAPDHVPPAAVPVSGEPVRAPAVEGEGVRVKDALSVRVAVSLDVAPGVRARGAPVSVANVKSVALAAERAVLHGVVVGAGGVIAAVRVAAAQVWNLTKFL